MEKRSLLIIPNHKPIYICFRSWNSYSLCNTKLKTSAHWHQPQAPQGCVTSIQGPDPDLQQAVISPSTPWAQPAGWEAYSLTHLQQACSHCSRQGLTANWAGASPTYQHTHSIKPCHNRRAHAPHIRGIPRAYISGPQRVACFWAPYNTSYKRSILQDWET